MNNNLSINQYDSVRSSFYITYAFLITTGTITFIEALRTNIVPMRHILNLETCISIIAALIPALAYYASLFTSVVFESRRLGIEAVSDLSDTDIDLAVHRQDYYNLILIVVPIATVVYALLSGFSPAGATLLFVFSF